MGAPPLVSGTILLPRDAPAAQDVPIYVRLLETRYADAPARVVATQQLHAARLRAARATRSSCRLSR